MVEARAAIATDIAALVQLGSSADDEKSAQRGGNLWRDFERSEYANESELSDPHKLLGVGTIDGVVVGFCGACIRQPKRPGRPIAQLDFLFVDPPAREVGVGEALMALVIEWAESLDCRGIDSIAMPGDRATKNFFESFGLVARAIKVHRPL